MVANSARRPSVSSTSAMFSGGAAEATAIGTPQLRARAISGSSPGSGVTWGR